MKKILAILLVLCMAIPLIAACDSKDDKPSTSASDSGTSASSEPEQKWPKEIGYFDPDFDYTQFKKFKIAYLIPTAGSFLYEEFHKAFESWAPRMNMDYKGMMASSDGSTEAMLSLLQTMIDQGYDGLLLDGIGDQMRPAIEMAAENGVALWSCMGICRDQAYPYVYDGIRMDGSVQWPFIGFDDYYAGFSMMNKLIAWKEATWPDVPWDKVGVACVGYSTFGQLTNRVLGTTKAWTNFRPEFGPWSPDPVNVPTNFWLADMSASGGFDQGTAQNLVTQILTAHTDMEVWLMPCAIDDNAMGAANAAELLGITDKSCAACFGGSNLPVQWDQGVDNSWRYAEFLAQTMFAEPIICALWAFMTGQSKPDELWPQWVKNWDKGDVFEFTGERDADFDVNIIKRGDDGKPVVKETHSYARALLPTEWLEKETYKQYLAWTDLYAYGDNTAAYHYGYPAVTDLNLYPSRVQVPSTFQNVAMSDVMG